MANFICIILPLVIFIGLFIRDCQLDRKRRLEQERLGNLHVLKKCHRFFQENKIKTENDFEKEIKLLENQSFAVTIWDYFSWKRY